MIDPRPYQVALDQAKANLAKDQAQLVNAKAQYDRNKVLYEQGVIAKQDLDTLEASFGTYEGTIGADKAAIENAQLNLTYCYIKSPVDGRVGLRMVDPGNYVTAAGGTAMIVVTQLHPISLVFTIPEDQLQEVAQHMKAGPLEVDAYSRDDSQKLATGTLLTINNQIDQTTGTVQLKATFANADNTLWPNQFVNAHLLLETRKDAITAPASAIQRGPDGSYVYAIDSNNTVQMRQVKIDLTQGTTVVIAIGLAGRRPGGDRRTGEIVGGHEGCSAGSGEATPRRIDGRYYRIADMSISRPFILRPIATSLLMVGLLLVGLVAYLQLPISALPQVDYPTIQVVTFYPGASPDVTASSITAPLERQFGELPGLSQMTSSSSFGASVITLQFNLEENIDVAEQEVQAAINAAQTFLPNDLPTPPIYSKVNPADAPILTLAMTSDSMPLPQVEDLADTTFAQKISQLPGVGLVSISGGQKPAIRIMANPTALASYGMSLEQLRTVIGQINIDQAKGQLQDNRQSFTIGANDQILSPQEYSDSVVAYKNGNPVRLSDVASVVIGPEDANQAAWMNTTPAVILNIQRQPGANIIKVVDSIKLRLKQLQANLPASVKVTVLTDRTNTIRASVKDVQFEMMLTIGLVVMVIFLFLRNLAATIIPSVTVPLSIVGTFGVMYLLGYSLDNLSLMALTISTGFVVDDAIVMIENIDRYIEEGHTPLEAALRGAGQIGFTIVSLTVSLIAVLIPLLFMGDIVGRLFREFAVTLSTTILISALISLTLTPMMCSLLLKQRDRGEAQQAV